VATIGEAFIEVHADTKPFDRELDQQLERAAKGAEKGLDRTGTQFGDKVSDSMSKRIGQRGKDFGKSVENATRNLVIRVRSTVRFDRIRNSVRRFFRRDVGEAITDEVEEALDRAGRKGGPLSKLGQGIADAIGSGFNVSGRSPLIAVLLPALAALLGVILAALQAVNALVAVLFIIPGLLASIGLQAGVLVIAFQGIGEAVQKAFAAKNAKELQEALKGLPLNAQAFVKSLLPLRALFREISQIVQGRFFGALGNIITVLRKALGPSLVKGFGDTAAAAGRFLRSFGLLLASPGFVKFFNVLVPATVRWLDKFGMSLFGKRGFVTAIINMATILTPFMEKFGDIIINNLDRLSGLIFQLGTNPGTQQWLDNMAATLQLFFDLLFKVGEFLFVFLAQLDKAGGQEIFKVLMDALAQLMFVLASPVGLKAMEGLVDFGILGIKIFTGLVVAVLAVFAALEVLSEWFRVTAGPFVLDVLRAIGQAAVDMSTFIGVWIARIIGWIGSFFRNLGSLIAKTTADWITNIKKIADAFVKWVKSLGAIPGQIAGQFKNFGGLLFGAGKALIQGLIDGIRAKIQPLLNLLSWIAGQIGGFFGNSPAIYGALSGRGWTKFRGQNIMQGLIEGIESEIPALRETTMNATSNIVFGRDSVQVNFQGAQPTETQARTVGNAVGNGAANFLAARNTRLVVRTL
jgi:hypothetical protein